MEVLIAFLLAFVFSFIGTIPPGTLNLTVIQLGLENRINTAVRFSVAASFVEFPYAFLAVKFENVITSSPVITENIQLLAGLVMVLLGIANIWSSKKPTKLYERFNKSGFRRGLILGFLNPLALPFWVAITAYMKSQGWIDLSDNIELLAYLSGVMLGALALFIALAYLAKQAIAQFQENALLKRIPGMTLLILGVYSLTRYFVG